VAGIDSLRNGMLHRFDDLLIERYEMVRAVSDFSDRRETEIYRLIARNDYRSACSREIDPACSGNRPVTSDLVN
jgi:hypothetical protein